MQETFLVPVFGDEDAVYSELVICGNHCSKDCDFWCIDDFEIYKDGYCELYKKYLNNKTERCKQCLEFTK